MATALVAASIMGLSIAAPASASDYTIDLGKFSIRDHGRSVDWTINFRCDRGDSYRATIELTQRNNRRWDSSGDARSDRVRCEGGRQQLKLNIPADEGRFTNGRARAEVVISSNGGRDWDRNKGGDHGNGHDGGRDINVTQWVQLRGGWDNNRAPDGY